MAVPSAQKAKESGNAAFKQSNFPLALAHYTTAISLDPSEFTYPLNRCMVYLKTSQWKEAEKDASTTLELMPGNMKALFRRGQARIGKKDWKGANQDLEDALKEGAAREDIEKELQRIPKGERVSGQNGAQSQVNGGTKPKGLPADLLQPKSTSMSPTATTSTISPSTSRLKAAISPSPPASSSPNTSNDLMQEVSTTRMSGGTSFAAKKEVRESRLNGPGLNSVIAKEKIKEMKSEKLKEVKEMEMEKDSESRGYQAEEKSPPSTIRKPPTLQQAKPVSAQQVDHAQTKQATTALFTPYSPPLPPPTSALSFETAWIQNSSPSSRTSILQSLNPNALPALFGSSLTPDLICEIAQTLALTPNQDESEGWKLGLLRGLRKVQRFSMAVGFLDESEKEGLKRVLERAREELESLQKDWEI